MAYPHSSRRTGRYAGGQTCYGSWPDAPSCPFPLRAACAVNPATASWLSALKFCCATALCSAPAHKARRAGAASMCFVLRLRQLVRACARISHPAYSAPPHPAPHWTSPCYACVCCVRRGMRSWPPRTGMCASTCSRGCHRCSWTCAPFTGEQVVGDLVGAHLHREPYVLPAFNSLLFWVGLPFLSFPF